MSPIQPAILAAIVVAVHTKEELADLEYWSRAIGAGRGGVVCVAVATSPEVRPADLLLAGATLTVREYCTDRDGAAPRMAGVGTALQAAQGLDGDHEIPWVVFFANAWERPVHLGGSPDPHNQFPPGWLWTHMADGISLDPGGAWRVTTQRHGRDGATTTSDPVRLVELTTKTKVAGVGSMHVIAPRPSVQRMAGFQLTDKRHQRETEEAEAARMDSDGALAQRAVVTDPSDPDAWVDLAAWRVWNNEDKAAIDALEMALSIEPALTEAILLLGVARLRIGYETLAAAVQTVPADHCLSGPWLNFLHGFRDVRKNTHAQRRPADQATK